MDTFYESSIDDDDLARLQILRDKVAAVNASGATQAALAVDPAAMATFAGECAELSELTGLLLQQANDLDVLYTMTVQHASTVEEELVLQNKTIANFLANMSHELRTPLTAIIGLSELLDEELHVLDDGADLATDAERITKSGRYLLSLINDVLDLSKVEAGRMQFLFEDVDMRAFAAEMEMTVEPLARRYDNTFVVQLSPEVGGWGVDETRVRQCVLNLLSNAFKFTHKGQVRLQMGVEQGHLVIRVSDTGVGMSAEQVAKVFEPYVQARTSTYKEYGGTGLGLSLTRKLCIAMGGSIELRSEPGEGATVEIHLPSRSPQSHSQF